MAEEVSTGGLVKFRYNKDGEKSKISDELKQDIQKGYEQFYARKARELRNKKILLAAAGLVLLALLGWAFLRLV